MRTPQDLTQIAFQAIMLGSFIKANERRVANSAEGVIEDVRRHASDEKSADALLNTKIGRSVADENRTMTRSLRLISVLNKF